MKKIKVPSTLLVGGDFFEKKLKKSYNIKLWQRLV